MGVRRRKKAAWRILVLIFCLPTALAVTAVLTTLINPDMPTPIGLIVTRPCTSPCSAC